MSPIGEVTFERPRSRANFSARDDDCTVRRADADSRTALAARRRYVAPEDADSATSCTRAASYAAGLASAGRNNHAVRNHDVAAISATVAVAAESARADSRAAEASGRADGLYAPGRGDCYFSAGRIVAASDCRAVGVVVAILAACHGLDARIVLDRDVAAASTSPGRANRRRAEGAFRRHVGIAADRDVATRPLVRRRADCRRVCAARDGRDLAARDDDVSATAVVVVHIHPLRACADGAAVFLDRNGLEIPLALDGERVPWGYVDG